MAKFDIMCVHFSLSVVMRFLQFTTLFIQRFKSIFLFKSLIRSQSIERHTQRGGSTLSGFSSLHYVHHTTRGFTHTAHMAVEIEIRVIFLFFMYSIHRAVDIRVQTVRLQHTAVIVRIHLCIPAQCWQYIVIISF